MLTDAFSVEKRDSPRAENELQREGDSPVFSDNVGC